MEIGIIGSGNIGGALAHRFRATGHEVTLANSSGPASLEALVTEIGVHAATVDELAKDKDVVVIAIPTGHVADLPSTLFADARDDLVVVDTGNYYPQQRDGHVDGIEASPTESGWVEQQLHHPVIKTFNMIVAPHLLGGGKPAGAEDRIALAVAGDDAAAKAKVMGLVNEIGFDAVDAGTIAESWRQQPGSPVYCKDLGASGVRAALATAHPERAPEWRATGKSPGTYAVPA